MIKPEGPLEPSPHPHDPGEEREQAKKAVAEPEDIT